MIHKTEVGKTEKEVFYSEILLLIEAFEKGNFEVISSAIDKFNILFKGHCGMPSNYIVGYKESNFLGSK